MADEAIKITIGAVKTASVDRVFDSIRRQAARIGQDLNRFLDPKKALKGITLYKDEITAAAGAVRAQRERIRQVYTDEERAQRRVQREREKSERFVHTLRMRQLGEESRARTREESRAARESASRIQRYARMTSWQAARSFGHGLNAGRRFLGEIGRGIGLDLTPATYLQQAIATQSAAIKLSNAGYMPGSARNGEMVPASVLQSEALDTARSLKGTITADQVLAGQEQYQKRTGDLRDTRDMRGELSRLAVATGSDAASLFGTAGELANQFKDVSPEERRKTISDLLRTFARQGQEGAVELEDLSKYGARIAASAGLYEGDKGDIIKSLGAIGQAARSFGGADSAAQAATSVSRLATTFKTGARAKEFQAITGKSVFSESGKIRNPVELIKEALVATQGDPLKWNKIFMNVMSERAAGGLGSKYREAYEKAGGGESGKAAGLKAIDEFLASMKQAQIGESEIQQKIDQVSQGYEAQVNDLNTTFQGIATEFLHEFLPALKEVAPSLKGLATFLGKTAIMAIEHPLLALGAGVTASLAKAGIETAFRAGVERMFMGSNELLLKKLAELAAGGGVPDRPPGAIVPGGGGRKLPFIGLGIAPAALAVAAGLLAPDSSDTELSPEQRAAKAKATADQRLQGILQGGDRESLSSEFGARISRQVFLEDRVKSDTAAAAAGNQGAGVRAEAYSKELAENKAALQELTRALRGIANDRGLTTQAGGANR